MEIGIVTPSYPPTTRGGGANSCRLIVENLREKGHKVEVISFDGEPENEQDGEGVQRYHFSTNRLDVQNIKARPKIADFSEGKDVIHAYGPMFMPAVGSLRGVKTIGTLNNYKFFYPKEIPGTKQTPKIPPYRRLHDYFCRKLLKRINKFTATSNDVKKYYTDYLSEEKINIIPEMLDPDFPEFHGIETNEKELLYVGAIEQKKGVKHLVQKMKDIDDYKLTVVGSGSQKSLIKEKVNEQEIENVDIKGYITQEELLKTYERAAWFIHPGKWPEPFGRTIIEAMQMKTPVIATNKGGPKDILPEEQLLNEVSEIQRKLEALNRERIILSQENILSRYSPSEITPLYEDIYNQLC